MRLGLSVLLAGLFSAGLLFATNGAAAPGPAKVGGSFRDCPYCPLMTVTPPGSFVMGSPTSQTGRGTDEDQHPVTIGYRLAVARFPVTRGEFARFVQATGRKVSGCSRNNGNNPLVPLPGIDWYNVPGQDDRHPVVCVSWEDASDYAAWLSQQTGHRYRLLSEAEWEYAARAGTTTRRYWGDASQCLYANGADLSGAARHPEWLGVTACNDGYPETSPVGRFRPNAFGLYDMLGNAQQWVSDCYEGDYKDVPLDGRPMESCEAHGHRIARIARGGAWDNAPGWISASGRDVERPTSRLNSIGFRLARTLEPQE